MKRRLTIGLIAAVILILAIVIPLAVFHGKDDDTTVGEKRLTAKIPALYVDEQINRNFMDDLKVWYFDHAELQEKYGDFVEFFQCELIDQASSDSVEIGKDGWYYYKLDNNLEIAKGEYPGFDEEALADICAIQVKIQQKLREQGIEYVLVLPPSKVSVYPEHIRNGDYSVIKTPADILADYLEARTDIKVVRLKDALLREKEEQQVYYKADTFWNQYGAYVGYSELISKLNEWGITTKEPVQATFTEVEHYGELSTMMGDLRLLGSEMTPELSLDQCTTTRVTSGDNFDRLSEVLQNEKLTGPSYMYENETTGLSRALMLGDGMFGQFNGWTATELLAQNFSEFTFVWDSNVRQSVLDAVQPDVVIYEMAERDLNSLITRSLSFALDRLPEYSAQILGYEIKDGDLYVTVQNTSVYPWTRDNQIKLCLWKNGSDWSKRAELPRNVQINHADTYTFRFEDIDENEIFNNKTEATMVQEGICYFGEKRILIEKQTDYRKNDAEILYHDTPASMEPSLVYTINITVKNTGNLAWSNSTQHKLVIYLNGTNQGQRVTLPADKIVMPGEEYTFTLEGFVAPQEENAYIEYQMVQEGIEYFGERERADIVLANSGEGA